MQACLHAYFDPYIEAPLDVPFCRDDSLICSPISSLLTSSPQGSAHAFCNLMGFKVQGTEQNLGKKFDAGEVRIGA